VTLSDLTMGERLMACLFSVIPPVVRRLLAAANSVLRQSNSTFSFPFSLSCSLLQTFNLVLHGLWLHDRSDSAHPGHPLWAFKVHPWTKGARLQLLMWAGGV
jgi:hypothetical protein